MAGRLSGGHYFQCAGHHRAVALFAGLQITVYETVRLGSSRRLSLVHRPQRRTAEEV